MSEIFISYARGEAAMAATVAQALRAAGYEVWRDDELPPHRAYAEVIEERIDAAKAVLVLWSPAAARSQWVRSEADRARGQGKLVQAALAPIRLPMPFDQIQCEDLAGWAGEPAAPAWRKLIASLAEMSGRAPASRHAVPTAAVAGGAAPAQPASQLPSIAVLPFAAGDEADRALADGVADEIVSTLSRFSQLKVVGSRAGLTLGVDRRSPAELSRELGARYFLEGGVRRAGGRLRVSLSLTDTGDLRQVWAERFDGAADEVFELQDRVAAAAAAQIAAAIEVAATRRALAAPAGELSAYELFLRAAHLERAFTREALQEAIAALELAADRDPGFVSALSFASLMHSLLVLNGWTDDVAATTRRAKELARQALHTGLADPEALAMIATVYIWLGEDAGASAGMVGRALAQNPSSPLPWFGSGWIELFSGRPAVAIEHFERHLSLDPRSTLQAFVAGGEGVALVSLRQFDEAAQRLFEALRAVPDHRPFRVALTAALAQLGRRDEAAAMLAMLPAPVIANTLALFRNPEHAAPIREGLRLAGADL